MVEKVASGMSHNVIHRRLRARTNNEDGVFTPSLPFAVLHAAETETTLHPGSNDKNSPIRINDELSLNLGDENISKAVLPFLGSIVKVKADDYSPVTGRLVSIKQNKDGEATIWLFTQAKDTGHTYISFTLNQNQEPNSTADLPVKSLSIKALDANPQKSKNSHYLNDVGNSLSLTLDSASIDQDDVKVLNWLSKNYKSGFIEFDVPESPSSLHTSKLHKLNSVKLEGEQLTFNYDPHKTFLDEGLRVKREPTGEDSKDYVIQKNSGFYNLKLVRNDRAGLAVNNDN